MNFITPDDIVPCKKAGVLKIALLCAAIFGGTGLVAQDYPDGIYFILPCSKYSQKPLPVAIAILNQSVCLAAQPFIGLVAFESVSQLYEARKEDLIFFDITLADKAFDTLQKITEATDSHTFALVANGGIMFLFDWDETNAGRVFRIEGSPGNRKIQQVHKQLAARFTIP